MSLQAFFAQNAKAELTEEIVISKRFQDQDGNPIKWKLKTLTEQENEVIRKAATRQAKGKNGSRVQELNQEDYIGKLAVSSVVYPDLQNVELQQSYDVIGADQLLKKMLLSGEYANFLLKVQEINGFERDIDALADEVKN
jgi:hypothetical protein